MGLVAYRGHWLSPEVAGEKVKADSALMARLARYNERRAELEASLDPATHSGLDRRKAARAHEKLGMWCDQEGLRAEAMAHFTTAIQFDPYHEPTWKRLGYLKHHGRWMTHEQIAADEREAHLQRLADKKWEPSLAKWKKWRGDKLKRAAADEYLSRVDDSRAVPSIVRVFASGPADDQAIAVSMLRRIDAPDAAQGAGRSGD